MQAAQSRTLRQPVLGTRRMHATTNETFRSPPQQSETKQLLLDWLDRVNEERPNVEKNVGDFHR
jgi:hypothetical protein